MMQQGREEGAKLSNGIPTLNPAAENAFYGAHAHYGAPVGLERVQSAASRLPLLLLLLLLPEV